MKLIKKLKRYCPTCKKHTTQKQELLKSGGQRGKLTSGARRHERRSGVHGYGSTPRPVAPEKAKTSHFTQLRYTCEVCKKMNMRRHSIRFKKITKE